MTPDERAKELLRSLMTPDELAHWTERDFWALRHHRAMHIIVGEGKRIHYRNTPHGVEWMEGCTIPRIGDYHCLPLWDRLIDYYLYFRGAPDYWDRTVFGRWVSCTNDCHSAICHPIFPEFVKKALRIP